MTAETGTIGYMAPEVLIGLPYDHKCDVYSFGICLWEIYSCSISYSGLSPHASSAMYKSRRPEIPNTCPSALANIMKQCWEDDPKKRPEIVLKVSNGLGRVNPEPTLPFYPGSGPVTGRFWR
ncbi:hypothetical protein CQW23_30739 [Capsicum baccatum]|uniref:Protein kinase domain-containing protein n=1 Tax=Capsicum baccatum TaxID=33114 RepID=A0A2G2V9P7_CAPBA|nr:hypothetical protein CQW23_30739 [Capsicum baccatum]